MQAVSGGGVLKARIHAGRSLPWAIGTVELAVVPLLEERESLQQVEVLFLTPHHH
jgi:hypothetical protein